MLNESGKAGERKEVCSLSATFYDFLLIFFYEKVAEGEQIFVTE